MSIQIQNVHAGYTDFSLSDIHINLPEGQFTALIGPNGCGKSTLFATMAGVLPLKSGAIIANGIDITKERPRNIAKNIALLPQTPIVPPAIRVEQLVAYGRAPYQNLFGIRRHSDNVAIEKAMELAGVTALRHRQLAALSGGQRQRAFIAMCLAQDTPIMLFDEPTSFLDIRYQYETLELLANLAEMGRTIVAVLHDIGQAAIFADHLVVMKSGKICYSGAPDEVVTADMLGDIYEVAVQVFTDPVNGHPQISPTRHNRLAKFL